MPRPLVITYVTSNPAKREELDVITRKGTLSSGERIGELFEVRVVANSVKETLEQDLSKIVRAEARAAYSQVKVPCIVEHAGLVFEGYDHYPGGLTKPMWNTLGTRFLEETRSAERRAVARAVIGYCDGMRVLTFVGETTGALAAAPRGSRAFYWDTVFVPDGTADRAAGKTYAEIVDDKELGLEFKVLRLSQSFKALKSFLEYLVKKPVPKLWAIT